VWAKQSSTTAGIESNTGLLTPLPICAAAADVSGGLRLGSNPQLLAIPRPDPRLLGARSLISDVCDVMSLVGLYSDLLDMPDVLQPRHRKYAEDLRLLGARGGALIERLMEQVAHGAAETPGSAPGGCVANQGPASGSMAGREVSC